MSGYLYWRLYHETISIVFNVVESHMTVGAACFVGSGGSYATALGISADDSRLSVSLWVKHMLLRNEEGVRIDVEYIARP
jgi:hypothetical protein